VAVAEPLKIRLFLIVTLDERHPLHEAGVLVRARYSTRNPEPGHRLRRRTSRGHEPRRGTNMVRLREARRLREPAQAPRPLGRRLRANPATRPVHLRGAERDLGARGPHGERRPGMDMPTEGINGIVHGQRRISADTALRLARYFDTSERFW
jgi:hypothetical protein